MFHLLSKTLDLLLAPLTWTFLLVGAGLALRRRPRLAWGLAVAGCAQLFAFSTPAVADALMRRAESSAPRTFRPDPPYDVAVVLGGVMERRTPWRDAGKDLAEAAERVTTALELVRTGGARHVLISGGLADPAPGAPSEAEQLAALLRAWGVPPEAIAVETRSVNTRQNAVESARVIAERGWRRVLLVTSAWHMPRALGCFRRAGVYPDALPVDYRGGIPGDAARLDAWLPRASELATSSEALREFAGRVVYRVAGYTRD